MSVRLIMGGPSDIIPDSFTVTDATGVALNTQQSVSVTPTGYDAVTIWSVSGGDADARTTSNATYATNGILIPGETLTIRRTSSPSYYTTVSTTVTIGTVTDTWDITTIPDTTPDAFTFTADNGASLSTVYTSSTTTITGLQPNYSFTLTVSGGTIDAGTSSLSGTFSSSKTVTSSATGTLVVAARVTSSASYLTAVSCTVTLNGISGVYTVTTVGDTTPDAFNFTDQSGVEPSTTYTSNTLTITGLQPNYSITITSTGTTGYQIDAGTSSLSGTWSTSKTVTTSASGTLVLACRVTSATFDAGTATVTATVGSVSDTWYVYTRAADTTPNGYSFTTTSSGSVNTTYTSDSITIYGIEPNYPIYIYCGISTNGSTPLIDAGTYALSGSFTSTKTVTASPTGSLVLAARFTTGSSWSTATMSVWVGTGLAQYSVTLASEAVWTTAGTYSWTVPSGLYSACALCVGAGGGGGARTLASGYSGGSGAGAGGSLVYTNSLSVTPGETLTIQVGSGGTRTTASQGSAGGNSSISRSGTILISGYGGKGANYFPYGGNSSSYTGGTGYSGGEGGMTDPYVGFGYGWGGGGGGAAGYAGKGGDGGYVGNYSTFTVGKNGAGGGGGGGGVSQGYPGSGGAGGGGGGGVGLYGQGSNGAAASTPSGEPAYGGGGGSGGSTGNRGTGGAIGQDAGGGAYGGGGGGAGATTGEGGPGGRGAVRIIWGSGRSFPSAAT